MEFQVVPAPGVVELESGDFTGRELALLNARRKARAAAIHAPADALVLGADTLVVLGGGVFGKPRNLAEARRMLARLQGRTHQVFTGVCLVRGGREELFAERTAVAFRRLTAGAIDAYFALVDPLDKAGAYGAQEHGDRIIAGVRGSWTNVMGLPMEALARRLAAHGLHVRGFPSADRQRIPSGSPWESVVGYSRAVRVGNHIFVAGTTASDENGVAQHPGDAAAQTRYVLAKIGRALRAAGASLRDVVRTRMFVTDISRWEEIGRAHGECFADVLPAATMVEVKALIDPALLVEIEADAVV